MSVDHYENFPVASFLLPAKLRPAVKNIYVFARTADDIADEGTAKTEFRQDKLAIWQKAIKNIYDKQDLPVTFDANEIKIFTELAKTINEYGLPEQAFQDLLSAFQQDLHKHNYANRTELLDYSSRSANPVGLLMLHLYGAVNDLNIQQSNAICTGLQLTNFWQDIAIDYAKGRCYIPSEDLNRHNLHIDDLAILCQNKPDEISLKWQALIKDLIDYTRQLLVTGSPLAWRLHGRIGWELRLVVHGGLRILEKLSQTGYNPFGKRPMLDSYDRFLLCWRGLRRPSLHNYDN